MKIPRYLLKETATIEAFLGVEFGGVVRYDDPVEERCQVEPGQRVVTDAAGQEVVAEAVAFFMPHVFIPPQSRLTWEGRRLTVIESRPHRYKGRTVYVEVFLR